MHTRDLIGSSLSEVKLGNEITERTATSLTQVIEGIGLLSEAAKDANEISASQSEAIQKIEEGLKQISDVVQSNLASSEEFSATSQELSNQSDMLKSLVDEFVLRDN